MKQVECRELIVSRITRRGKGTDHDPIRVITEVFEKNGTKIAEHDPDPATFQLFDLIHFARWIQKKDFDASKADTDLVEKWLDEIVDELVI